MLIPHIFKNPSKFRSDNWRTKKDMEGHFFQNLLQWLISFIYCENANSLNVPLTLESIS